MRIYTTLILATLALAACSAEANPELEAFRAAEALAQEHLATFDDLDFNAFTNQDWEAFHRSHAEDIVVHWPDGRVTEGFDVHIQDLQAMFVYMPDTRILEHPIRIGSGPWTAVMGYMEGTFSQPMPLPDGTFIPPTQRSYRIAMATIGHWTDGVMDEEWLFWDNQSFMSQIGLGGGS
jgi:hypothetical protein